MAALAISAGFEPVGRIVARRSRVDPATYIGRGKTEAIGQTLSEGGVELVVFDHELSAVQQRNLGERWSVPVLDRTELILAIFGQRARSHEGKLQVELARLEHLSARLVRGWTHLERQRGGIGVRGGPGEKQIELDRRMLGDRVKRLRVQLDRLQMQRRNRRRSRERNAVFRISLVGYTNAGKSTLFNALTGAGALAVDQLFATLDTLSRRLVLPSGQTVIVSDTVGFVRDLPHQLVEAFRATLEETAEADLLLHVVDASSPDRLDQIAQVERVLAEIGAGEIPVILVQNKIDLLGRAPEDDGSEACDSIARVSVSASTGAGVDALVRAIDRHLRAHRGVERRHRDSAADATPVPDGRRPAGPASP